MQTCWLASSDAENIELVFHVEDYIEEILETNTHSPQLQKNDMFELNFDDHQEESR